MHLVLGIPRGGSASVMLACALAAGEGALAQSACTVAHLAASDGAGFDNFGRAVAVSGNVAIAGAIFHVHGALNTGAAYVYAFNGTTWTEVQELLPSDGQGKDEFGWSVAIDGGTALVGTTQAPGSAYVYQSSGRTWLQQQKLLAFDGQLDDGFGWSVSVRGDVAVIGALGDSDNGQLSGSAYVYRLHGTSWLHEQKLLASDGAAGDQFGSAVAVFNDVAVVGAAHGTNQQGAAYVFRFDGTSWNEEQKLVASDGAFADEFGTSVSCSGAAVLIGASGDDDSGMVSGSAYVFQFDQGTSTWVQDQKLLASDGAIGDQFGRSVAIDGGTAIVGAWLADAAGTNSGAAYVFRASGGRWWEQDELLPDSGPPSARFGVSVALSGDIAMVGAHGEDGLTGAAYVAAGLFGVDCNDTGQADSCDIFLGLSDDADGNGIPDECQCPWDLDGGGAVEVSDFLGLLAAWSTNPGGPPDFDGDGTVGVIDFLQLLTHWGPCP